MCIHDQCDTILMSVEQRIVIPPLTSAGSSPLRTQQTVQSEYQHCPASKTFQNQFLTQSSAQAVSPCQCGAGRGGEAWPLPGGGPGRASAGCECVHCSEDRERLTRPAALIRHGPWRREGEREEREGRRTDQRPRPGEPRGSVRCTEPGRAGARLIVNSHMINLSA